MKLMGGCQCGAKRFGLNTQAYEAYYCHCRMCQRAVGNVFAAFVNVAKADLTWEKSGPDIYHSSKIAERGFCAQCGTPLSFSFPDLDRMDLMVGAFDDPSIFKPTSHFGVEGRLAAWHGPDGLPEKRVEDSGAIVARWEKAYGPGTKPGQVK